MSSEHKAFVFDYENFESELKPILETSLDTGIIKNLEYFITVNISDLKNPYDGEQLLPNWKEMIEYEDTHQYGDFALTKFYNPDEDIGLGSDWIKIQNVLLNEFGEDSAVLGIALGTNNNYFDPGKMGSYFQSYKETIQNKDKINTLLQSKSKYFEYLQQVLDMFENAITSRKGLYICF